MKFMIFLVGRAVNPKTNKSMNVQTKTSRPEVFTYCSNANINFN